MFEFESEVRYSETDSRQKLNAQGIINYFQDCTTLQSAELGAGLNDLRKKDLAWVLSAWQIDIFNAPSVGDKITVGTYPYEYKNIFGKRNFIMKDKEGNVLAVTDSLWILLNYTTGKPVRVGEDVAGVYTLEEQYPMEIVKGRITLPDNAQKGTPIRVMNHHLDVNLHVNNGRYVEMLLDNVEVRDYSRLRVEYRKMAHLDDILTPVIAHEEGKEVLFLMDESDEVCCAMEIYYD